MLKSFVDFIKLKENGDDYNDNEALYNAVDIAWKMNRPKLFAILKDIAQEDENSRLNDLINILQKQITGDLNKTTTSAPTNNKRDELMPPVADTGQGLDRFE